jgi:hypothetical protein
MLVFLELRAISQGLAMMCSIVGHAFLYFEELKLHGKGQSGNKMDGEHTH